MDLKNVDPNFLTCNTTHSISAQLIKFSVQCAYTFGTSIIYLFIIIFIIRKHKSEKMYSDEYFKIYVFDGIVSLIVLLLDYSITRPLIYVNPMCHLLFDHFSEFTYYLTPYLFAFNYFQFARMFSMSLLCANRFTCIVFPIWHQKFWKRYIICFIVLCLFLPICFTWHLGIARTKVNVYDGEGLIDYERVVPFVRTTYFKFFISASIFIFIIVSHIMIFRSMSKLNRRLKGVEKSLTQTTAIICIVFLVYIIVQGILMIFSTKFLVDNIEFGSTVMKLQFICYDLYLMSSPLALIITNRHLRISFLCSSKRRSSSITEASSTNTKFSNLARVSIHRKSSQLLRF